MVPHCLEAIQHLRVAENLSVDLAVVTQLSPVPASHIGRILDETKPALSVYVEEASVAYGWSAEMLAQVHEQSQAFDRPIAHERIGAGDSPIPSGRDLERVVLPQVHDIVTRVLGCF